MSLFDVFFPEAAQASHLRKLVAEQTRGRHTQDQNNRGHVESTARIFELEQRTLELERDLGFVSLLLAGVLDTIESKEVATRDDIHDAVQQLDAIDGFKDGRLDIDVLRGKMSK